MSANHTEPPSKGKRKKKNSHIRWIVTVFFVAVVISSTISFFSSTVLEGAGLVEAFLVLLLIVALGIVFDIIGVAVMSVFVVAVNRLFWNPLQRMAERRFTLN